MKSSTQNIVWFLRVPRVLLGGLVGAGLTLSGICMQAFTKNPLAEPYVLGISSGASLGAVLAMLAGVWLPWGGRLTVSTGAFAGALVSMLFVYTLARTGNYSDSNPFNTSGSRCFIFIQRFRRITSYIQLRMMRQ